MGARASPTGSSPGRLGWAGVFGGLLRASGTGGPGWVRAFPRPPTRVAGPTEKRALSLLRNPWPGQLGRAKGGKGCAVPPENSLGGLPYCALGSLSGWPGVGRGLLCPQRHPYPRMVDLDG